MEIGIKLLSVEAKKTHKSTSQSLGWDLYSAETKIIEAQSSSIIRTDISIQLPITFMVRFGVDLAWQKITE